VEQEQRQAAITKTKSFMMARNLLRISLFQIAYVRNLFPSSYFCDRTIFDDLNVKVLKPHSSSTSQRLVDWMEKGVCDAIYKSYLKRLRFGITRDKEGKDLIEEYVFTFAYEGDGEIRLQILNSIRRSPVNTLATDDARQLKGQVAKMTRLLVALMTSFDPLPEAKHISLHLEYYETRTPKSYEPPFFEAAPKLPHFEQKPFSMGLGACQTKDVCIGMKAKTTAVSDLEDCGLPAKENVKHHEGGGRVVARDLEPSQVPEEDVSSLDTVFDHARLGGSQPEDAMKLVNDLVTQNANASQWASEKMNHSQSYEDDTASEFQCLSITRGRKIASSPKDGSQDIAWDNIPLSQDTFSCRKKVSRGILGTREGPSKRIKMQED